MQRFCLFLLVAFVGGSVAAQSVFDAAFRFRDGIYLSHSSLLANRPDLSWSAIDGEMVQLPADYRVQVDGYKAGEKAGTKPAAPPYAISLDGKAYLFVRHDTLRDFHEFAGLRVHGPFAAMRYDTIVRTRQLMRAYNPINGLVFREAWVERDRERTLQRVVDMRDGRRLPLDPSTLMRLVDSENDLVSALRATRPTETEKMLRALKIYAERHPFTLPAASLNR